MAIRRGAFESVGLSASVAGSAEHTTFRPDIGTALRTGAGAMKSVSDMFGKLADFASAAKGKMDSNKGIQMACRDEKANAISALKEYDSAVKSGAEKENADTRNRLTAIADSASKRYDASMKLGLFSNKFNMDLTAY